MLRYLIWNVMHPMLEDGRSPVTEVDRMISWIYVIYQAVVIGSKSAETRGRLLSVHCWLVTDCKKLGYVFSAHSPLQESIRPDTMNETPLIFNKGSARISFMTHCVCMAHRRGHTFLAVFGFTRSGSWERICSNVYLRTIFVTVNFAGDFSTAPMSKERIGKLWFFA